MSYFWSSDSFGRGLAFVAVGLAIALARKYVSAYSMERPEGYSQEDADARFPSTQVTFGGSMIVMGIVLVWGVHFGLVYLNRRLTALDGPSDFQIRPQTAIWWFFPGIGALALAWEITLQIWGIFAGRNAPDVFSYWTCQKAGYDARKVLRWMGLVVALPIGVLTALALPMHTVLRENDVRDCGYGFATCKVYRYSDARRMTEIEGFRERDGRLDRRAGIVIDFSDGRRWSSGDEGDFHSNVDPAFVEFLETKTRLPLHHAPTESDIPSLNAEP
jgi:hypothetical protein